MQTNAATIRTLYNTYISLFTWVDGPLVDSMKRGELFLIDEISLAGMLFYNLFVSNVNWFAEDSVLERLNSVLEPHRLLVLAEKGGKDIEEITAVEDFRVMATMNPGGDFGKKELSPAMRNRFTEIWVPSISSHDDLKQIIEERFTSKSLNGFSQPLLSFIEWFLGVQRGRKAVSLRDILAWVGFMNETVQKNLLAAHISFVHGACLVLLDGLGVGSSVSNENMARKLKLSCLEKLVGMAFANSFMKVLIFFAELLPGDQGKHAHTLFLEASADSYKITPKDSLFGIAPFYIPIGPVPVEKIQFSLEAPTTSNNVQRVLRGMQLPRAILLEVCCLF